jgi:hypothetical protein
MTTASRLPRPVKAAVAQAIGNNLARREQGGPPEPALDAFIPQLQGVATRLSTHVEGKDSADNTRRAQLLRLELGDMRVDKRLRHVTFYIRVEAEARGGPNVEHAEMLHEAASLGEMSTYVDAYVPDENRYCWNVIKTLEHPDHAAAVVAIGLPKEWLTEWKAELTESQEAFDAAGLARGDQGTHTGAGQDAEADFTEIMFRLRRYIDSRADRRDTVKVAEGKGLIQPLLDALEKAKVDAAARATRRKKAEATAAPIDAGTGDSGNT